MIDAKVFFDRLRSNSPLGPTLSQDEVDGVNTLLKAFSGAPTCWVAYALATAYHETAGTMLPIKERGSENYLRRMYDVTGKDPKRAILMGNTTPGDGVKYCGRGYSMITWKTNYKRLGQKIGVDLVNNPEYAMHPDTAAAIMDIGMTEGWFTGISFSKVFKQDRATREDFRRARAIINGTDDNDEIAVYALSFQDALAAAGYSI
jgi:putative chitinase